MNILKSSKMDKSHILIQWGLNVLEGALCKAPSNTLYYNPFSLYIIVEPSSLNIGG